MFFLDRRKKAITMMFAVLFIATFFIQTSSIKSVPCLAYNVERCLVLDAGHGGVDGGAVSASGIIESDINLAITLRTYDLLQFLGQNVRLTRTDANGLYDKDSTTIRKKKIADTHNRVAIINNIANAAVISIHQNSMPSHPSVHGAQVFHNHIISSDILAESIQSALNCNVNAGNEKKNKKIPNDVYLMANIDRPAALVECGFLSNPEETVKLQQSEYQAKLAVSIVCGYLVYKEGDVK